MNALLAHRWGVSPAQDRVWTQVTGMRPSAAVAQLLMVFQAFTDDSRSKQPQGVFVLGACVSKPEAWANFAGEWEELLPLAPLGPDMQRHFKFSEIVKAGDDRIRDLPVFAKPISTHVPLHVVFYMNTSDLFKAQRRIKVPGININWGDYENPYLFAFLSFLDVFHGNRDAMNSILGSNEDVDFIFDEQSEKSKIIPAWDAILSSRAPGPAKERLNTSSMPRFENDRKFLPLQAVDFLAGWSRYCIENSLNPAKGLVRIGGHEIANPFTPMAYMVMTEPHILKFLVAMVKKNLPDGYPVDDVIVSEDQSS